jgi:hypothetical protein
MYRVITRVGILLLLAGIALMFLFAPLVWSEWLAAPLTSESPPTGAAVLFPAARMLGAPLDSAIVITATVGISPHECATTQSVTVTAGTPVVYCYRVINSGDITLTDHLITDERLNLRAAITDYYLTPWGGPQPTFYFTALITALASVQNTVVWTATNQTGDFAVAQATAQVIVPAIVVTHTVGRDPSHCAETRWVAVMPETEVTHCYRVENTSEVTFTLHLVEDSRLGLLAEQWPYSLTPGTTVALTATEVATQTSASTVTWTAVVTEGLYATATDRADIELPAITVSTTVGYDPGECAETTLITVTVGQSAIFCYRVFNKSAVDFSPLVVYDQLFDDEPIVVTATLLGNGELGFTLTAPITQSIANTVTWVAQAEGDLTAQNTAPAYVLALARLDVETFEDSNGNLIRDPEEAGFAGVTLTLETEDELIQIGHTDEDGRLSFMALATNYYTLTLSADGLQGYEVKPSMTQRLPIESGGWYQASFALIQPTNLHLPMVWRE